MDMHLKDYFACEAMKALIINKHELKAIPDLAYEIAQKMFEKSMARKTAELPFPFQSPDEKK